MLPYAHELLFSQAVVQSVTLPMRESMLKALLQAIAYASTLYAFSRLAKEGDETLVNVTIASAIVLPSLIIRKELYRRQSPVRMVLINLLLTGVLYALYSFFLRSGDPPPPEERKRVKPNGGRNPSAEFGEVVPQPAPIFSTGPSGPPEERFSFGSGRG